YIDPGYDYYNSVEIVSIYKVIKEVELDFEKIPTIIQMMEDMRENIKQEKAKLKSDEERKERVKDKELLKQLLNKYGTP
ncbi:unnamed protein product, partial [marine sediment metagenome]